VATIPKQSNRESIQQIEISKKTNRHHMGTAPRNNTQDIQSLLKTGTYILLHSVDHSSRILL